MQGGGGGAENDGPSKLQDMKCRTWKWRTQLQGMKMKLHMTNI